MNKNIKTVLKKYDILFQEKLSLIDFNEKVVPHKNDILNAFSLLENDVKVVILGQDPYYLPGYANGLAFSCNYDCKIPRSLQNIFKELKNSIENFQFQNGDLSGWAQQGVLLLNTSLTTIENKPLAHKHVKWEEYTSKIINEISNGGKVVFILLGKHAQNFKKYIEEENNLILCTSHPSPLSANRGFLGSNIFIKTNQYLTLNNLTAINWNLKKEV